MNLRERALRLLARREHAHAELARKLAPHAESADVLEALLGDLKARNLLSETRYVEMRVTARAQRFGNARLAHELRTQGVAESLISEALAESDDELSRARIVWHKKFGEQGVAIEAAAKARQIRFLQARGFSSDTIRRLLRAVREDLS